MYPKWNPSRHEYMVMKAESKVIIAFWNDNFEQP